MEGPRVILETALTQSPYTEGHYTDYFDCLPVVSVGWALVCCVEVIVQASTTRATLRVLRYLSRRYCLCLRLGSDDQVKWRSHLTNLTDVKQKRVKVISAELATL